MALKPGTISDFNNSMAQDIETAFLANWPLVMGKLEEGGPAIPESNNQMKLMFIAIATGVIEHLKKNPTAFVVDTTDNGLNTATGNVTSIL
jgi:hypothetical protein